MSSVTTVVLFDDTYTRVFVECPTADAAEAAARLLRLPDGPSAEDLAREPAHVCAVGLP